MRLRDFLNFDENITDSLQITEAEMPPEFGLPLATYVVVASMVGTGILTTSGYTMASVGSNLLMLGLWLVGGLIAVCGALTLAELSSTLPRTGGDYVYLHEAYGPLVAFLSGWVSFVIGFSGPAAAAGIGSAKYLLAPLRLDPASGLLAQRGLATLAILGFALNHVSGRRATTHLQSWITLVKIFCLVVFIAFGLAAGSSRVANLNDLKPITLPVAQSMLLSLVYIYYAYTGWNGASYLAGEIRDAQRVLPRAILIGTALVAALYLGMNLVYALALSNADLSAIINSPDNRLGFDAVAPIAAIAASRLFGPSWSSVLSVAFGLMLFSTLSVYLLLGPRVIYAMARAGQFPAAAASLSRGASTPVVATVLQVAMALVFVWVGSLQDIIGYASVGLSIFSLLSMSSIYVLRIRRPDLPRPFRTPGYPITPGIYLILTGMLTLAAFARQPRVSFYALLSILAGVPFYYLWRILAGRSALVAPKG
jgi:APA family basic amino acid/polyamine antiporter